MGKYWKIFLLILSYYVTSLGLGFFTIFFLSKTAYNFRFPLFKSSVQNLVCFVMAYIILKFKKKDAATKSFMWTTIPCAISGALDIGLSSFSLRTVPFAFYTMVKSSAPVFILLSGMMFGIESPSITFFLIIFTIGSGVFLTSYKNTNFDATGFSIISMASFMAGFRWAFIQYLINKRQMNNGNLCDTIKDLCLPVSFILFILSFYKEGFYEIVNSEFFNNSRAAAKNFGFITVSGLLSFLLIAFEFKLVSMTSVIFLSVSSIAKELIIVFFSLYRKDIQLTTINYIGLLVSVTGIIFYNLKRSL